MKSNMSAFWSIVLLSFFGLTVLATEEESCDSACEDVKSTVLLQKQQMMHSAEQLLASATDESLRGCGSSQTIPMHEAGPTLDSMVVEPESKALGFVFIPQSNGRMVEALGRKAGINWGFNSISHTKVPKILMSKHEVCTWHLVPPRFLAGTRVYSNKPLFCITRDPAERLLSSYLQVIQLLDAECPIAPKDHALLTKYEKCTPESLNYFATEALKRTEFAFDCNLIPQSKYIWDWDGNQVCNEIIHFKNMTAGLGALFGKYNIPVSAGMPMLIQTFQNAQNAGPCPGLSSADFDANSTLAIRDYYHEDYVALGFN
jgi:hypothetical protein